VRGRAAWAEDDSLGVLAPSDLARGGDARPAMPVAPGSTGEPDELLVGYRRPCLEVGGQLSCGIIHVRQPDTHRMTGQLIVNLLRTAASSGQRVIEGQSVTVSAALTRPDRRSNHGQAILKGLQSDPERGSDLHKSWS